MDSRPGGDLVALASGAMRGVMAAIEEHYKPRAALELQLVRIRMQRELEELTGDEMDPVAFTHSDFDHPPTTPAELAKQLGHDDEGRAVRRVLRAGFAYHPLSAGWELTTKHVSYVQAHLPARD